MVQPLTAIHLRAVKHGSLEEALWASRAILELLEHLNSCFVSILNRPSRHMRKTTPLELNMKIVSSEARCRKVRAARCTKPRELQIAISLPADNEQ